MKTYNIKAARIFPSPLFINSNVMGNSYDINVADHWGELILPCLPDEWEEEFNNHKIVKVTPSDERLYYSLKDWGYIRNNNGVSQVNASEISFTATKEEALFISNEIDKNYIPKLILFLEVLTGTNITGLLNQKLGSTGFYNFETDTPSQIVPQIIYETIKASPSKGIEHDEFTKAIKYTNENRAIELAHLILRDAREKYMNTDYRSCITMLGTAVEVTLTEKWKEFLKKKGLNETEISNDIDTKKNYRTLNGRIEMAFKVLKIEMFEGKNTLKSRFGELRNKIVHDGYNPTRNQAKYCLDISNKIINQYSSLIV